MYDHVTAALVHPPTRGAWSSRRDQRRLYDLRCSVLVILHGQPNWKSVSWGQYQRETNRHTRITKNVRFLVSTRQDIPGGTAVVESQDVETTVPDLSSCSIEAAAL